jgi:hypothetical protein
MPRIFRTRYWPAYIQALERLGELAIWSKPEMIWEATPTDKLGWEFIKLMWFVPPPPGIVHHTGSIVT